MVVRLSSKRVDLSRNAAWEKNSHGTACEGKVALITGSAIGIGLAIVERTAREGAIMIVSDIDEARGQATATSTAGRFIRHT